MRLSVIILVLNLTLNISPAHALSNVRAERIKSLLEDYKNHRSAFSVTVQPAASPAPVPALAPRKPSKTREVQPLLKKAPRKAMPKQEIFAIVEREATRVGISPVVMYAIEVHESGNYQSKLWHEGFNPGGIEYRSFPGINCWRNPRKRRWACFASAEDGIRAHAYVLANRRYDGARRTDNELMQVEAIGRAGYCEKPWLAGWLRGIKTAVRRLTSPRNVM